MRGAFDIGGRVPGRKKTKDFPGGKRRGGAMGAISFGRWAGVPPTPEGEFRAGICQAAGRFGPDFFEKGPEGYGARVWKGDSGPPDPGERDRGRVLNRISDSFFPRRAGGGGGDVDAGKNFGVPQFRGFPVSRQGGKPSGGARGPQFFLVFSLDGRGDRGGGDMPAVGAARQRGGAFCPPGSKVRARVFPKGVSCLGRRHM